MIWAHGKAIRAHRFAYEDVCGPVPSGTCVLHRCDNPGCVRPDHLFLGSHRDNTDDKVRKGRHSRGRSVHTAKLTEDQVLEIRALYAAGDTSLTRLGAAYGVDHTVVCDIVHRRSWKHV